MEPASVALAVLGTVVELYRLSMKTYDLYLSIQDFPPAFRKLRLALDIERKRLEQWAHYMGLEKGSGINDRLRNDAGLLDIVHKILEEMTLTFNDCATLLDEYREIPSAEVTNPGLSRQTSSSTRKKLETAARAVKWVTRDKKKLENLVRCLKEHNDHLDHLAPNIGQAAMRRKWRTEFVTIDEPDQLHLLREAAHVVGHKDLEQVASSKWLLRRALQDEELSSSLETLRLDAPAGFDTEESDTARNWRLAFNQLHYNDHTIMANDTRILGTYWHVNGEKESVLVDWSRCRDDSWRRHNQAAFHVRASNLVRILNRDLLPKGFRVLRCIGYLEAASNVTGYLFQPPPEAVSESEPVSLYKILNDTHGGADIPDLGDRFELAKAIVSTLFEFHNIGWLHKNLHPKNILFWRNKRNNGRINIREPYIVGFGLSRSDRPDEVSEKPLTSVGDDLYRHPAYKEPEPGPFKPSYDFFSLGVILFEIALWRLVTTSQSSRSNPAQSLPSQPSLAARGEQTSNVPHPNFVRDTVMNKAKDLGRFTGAKYRDAVLACIQGDFDEVWDLACEDERTLKLQQAIQPKVVDAIEFCYA